MKAGRLSSVLLAAFYCATFLIEPSDALFGSSKHKKTSLIPDPRDPKRFPRPLSWLARAVYERVVKTANENPDQTPVEVSKIGTAGHFINSLPTYGDTDIMSKEFFYPHLMKAQEEVLICTFIFSIKNSPSAAEITRAVRELNERARQRRKRMRVYIVIDTLGAAFFSHEKPSLLSMLKRRHEVDPTRYNLPPKKEMDWLDFRVKNYHRGLLGAVHSKMMLIDGRMSLLGSKNMDGDTPMEFMFALDGPVTLGMRSDFQYLWKDKLPELNHGGVTAPRPNYDVPILLVGRSDSVDLIRTHSRNAPQDQAWFAALENAKQEVYIQTPNYTTKEMLDAVIKAVKRGIKVMIVESFRSGDKNAKLQKDSAGTNGEALEKSYQMLRGESTDVQNRLQMCWFIGKRAGENARPDPKEWSHVKLMIVDRQITIVGSGNQDPQSWYHSREDNVLIDDKETTMKIFSQILGVQQSLKNCHRYK